MSSLDAKVAMTLDTACRTFIPSKKGSQAGIEFEDHLHARMEQEIHWQHCVGPNQMDFIIPLQSKTGITYEFDGIYLGDDTFYFVEAKYLTTGVTREHITIFVHKLIDMVLGSATEIGARAIMPVFVSGLDLVDMAAYSAAISWGILLVTPSLVTPHSIITRAQQQVPSPPLESLIKDCLLVNSHVWRSFQSILHCDVHNQNTFMIQSDHIFSTYVTAEIRQLWLDCIQSALHHGLITFPSIQSGE
jgi:hypothetical protein